MPNPVAKVLIYSDDVTGELRIVHPERAMRVAVPAYTVDGVTVPAVPAEGEPEYIADIKAKAEADGQMAGFTFRKTLSVNALPADRANRANWRYDPAGGGTITGG